MNIPGDFRVAPLEPKPWPGGIVIALMVLWPGLATGVIVGLHAFIDRDWSALVGVFAGMIGVVVCLTWPWAAAEVLLPGRIHEQGRRRFMPWLPLGAMIGNVALAVGVGRVMYLLA